MSDETPTLCNAKFVTTAGAPDLFINVNSAKFATDCPATRAEAIGDEGDRETDKSVPETIGPETGPEALPAFAIALVLGPKYPAAGEIPFSNWNFTTAAFVKGPK